MQTQIRADSNGFKIISLPIPLHKAYPRKCACNIICKLYFLDGWVRQKKALIINLNFGETPSNSKIFKLTMSNTKYAECKFSKTRHVDDVIANDGDQVIPKRDKFHQKEGTRVEHFMWL